MKRLTALLLSVCLLCSFLPLAALAAAASPFSGGDGSEENPYLVSSPEALDAVRNDRKAYYRQTADIDLSIFENWTPIPDFKGVYDGGGYTISSLKIHATANYTYLSAYGLFADAISGTIRNVILTNIDFDIQKPRITDYIYGGIDYRLFVGGIAGSGGDLENCSVSGQITVNGVESYVGGIVGRNHGELYNCSNFAKLTVSISDLGCCGGIAGYNTQTINHAQNIGEIEASGRVNLTQSGTLSIGGICGYNDSGKITNVINRGTLTCSATSTYYSRPNYAGGIVGKGGEVCFGVNYGNIVATSTDEEKTAFWTVGGVMGYCNEQFDMGAQSCLNLTKQIVSEYMIDGVIAYSNTAARINGSFILGGMGNHTPSFKNCFSLDTTLVNDAIVIPPETNSIELTRQGKNISAEDCLLESSYPGFDFANTWIIDPAVGGAVLRVIPYSSAPIEPLPPAAPFIEEIYRTDHLLYGYNNIYADPALYNLLLTNQYNPSTLILEMLPDDMNTAASAWEAMKAAIEAADGKLSPTLKCRVEQEEFIMAYILTAINSYTEMEYADIVKKNFKNTENLVKLFTELNGTFAASGDEFKKYIKDKDDDIEKVLEEYYQDTDPTMAKLLKTQKGISVVGAVINSANSIEDVIAQISSYSALYGINESTKDALRLMYELCPEESVTIKNALGRTVEVISSATEAMVEDIIQRDLAIGMGAEASLVVTDQLWGYITNTLLSKGSIAGQLAAIAKLEMTIVDKCFGIDARLEQYFKLCVLSDVNNIAAQAVKQSITNYEKNPTAETASVFLAAVDLKFGFMDQDYKESIRFSEIITDSGAIQKFENWLKQVFNIESANELKKDLLKAEKFKDALHCIILTSWISALDAENHNVAKEYYEYREKIYTLYQPELAEQLIPMFRSTAKQYSIHCPVNVTIYSPDGKPVAEIGETACSTQNDIIIVYDHGQKDIYFLNNTPYIIVCEGYDSGDMDIEIKEFDASGAIVRKLNYNNLSVSVGSTYTLIDSVVTNGNNETTESDYDSAENAPLYSITIQNGVISDYLFEAQAGKGERVDITALVPDGYRFIGWQVSGGDVLFEDESSASTYFFMPDSDVAITAQYQNTDAEDDSDEQEEEVAPNEFPILPVALISGVVIVCAVGCAVVWLIIRKNKRRNQQS